MIKYYIKSILSDEEAAIEGPRIIKASPTTPKRNFSKPATENITSNGTDTCHLTIPKVMATSSSSDTLTGMSFN